MALVYHKRLFGQSVQAVTDLTPLDAWKTNSHAPDKREFVIDAIMLFLKSYNPIIVTRAWQSPVPTEIASSPLAPRNDRGVSF